MQTEATKMDQQAGLIGFMNIHEHILAMEWGFTGDFVNIDAMGEGQCALHLFKQVNHDEITKLSESGHCGCDRRGTRRQCGPRQSNSTKPTPHKAHCICGKRAALCQ